METPGSAPWAGPWGRSQARGRPKSTTPARRARAALPEAPLLRACPAHTQPCAPPPRSPSPNPALASRAIAGQCPHRTPPSPEGDATQSHFHHGTGKTQRPWRGGVSVAGVGGRGREGATVTHLEWSWGLVSGTGGGAGTRGEGTAWRRAALGVKGQSSPREGTAWKSPSVSPEDAEWKASVREAHESSFLPRLKGN